MMNLKRKSADLVLLNIGEAAKEQRNKAMYLNVCLEGSNTNYFYMILILPVNVFYAGVAKLFWKRKDS